MEIVSVDDHLDRILAGLTPLPDDRQPLLDALGLTTTEDVVSTVALPSFDNSAMDGYAVVAADVASASPESPTVLPVVGEIGAGQAQLLALSPGTSAKIMTGAPVPVGCDAVVPYELTDRGVARVSISTAPRVGQHIRPAGEDVAAGDLLIERGTVLGPRHLGLLAAVGRAGVRVRPRPRVVVISTGSELRDAGTSLGHDSIYDGNSYLLAAAARAAGAIVYRVGIVPDEPSAFLSALSDQLVRADLVVTSGGVSMGDYDVVKEALAPLGTVWFGPVAMQPGKPQGFGHVGGVGLDPGGKGADAGETPVPIFTLPGNPVSSYISFQQFVLPAIRFLMGQTPVRRPTVQARLTHAVRSSPGRRQFVRAQFTGPQGSDAGSVTPVGGHGSHLIGDLASSDALIVVSEDVTELDAGAEVSVLLLDRDF